MKYIQQGKQLIFRLLLLALCAAGLLTGCVQLEDMTDDRGAGYQDLVLIEDDEESFPEDSGERADVSEGIQGDGSETEEYESILDGTTDTGDYAGALVDTEDLQSLQSTSETQTVASTQRQDKTKTTASAKPSKSPVKESAKETTAAGISEKGTYTSPEDVAAYIHRFRHLPSNYITKRDAEDLGWSSSRGNLWDVAYGMSIGGSRFGNYEGQLPDKSGRKWYECDVNYEGGYRGAERILYSNDGLIYYTDDHYETFTKLY